MIIYKPTKFLVETHRGAGSAGPAGAKKHPWGAFKIHPGGASKNHPGGAIKNHPGGALKNHPGGALKNHPGGALKNHPGCAVQWSRVRATCGPLEPCACNLRTTRAVCARPADHRSRVRPSEALGRVLARTGAERGRARIEPQNHRATGP